MTHIKPSEHIPYDFQVKRKLEKARLKDRVAPSILTRLPITVSRDKSKLKILIKP